MVMVIVMVINDVDDYGDSMYVQYLYLPNN